MAFALIEQFPDVPIWTFITSAIIVLALLALYIAVAGVERILGWGPARL